LSLEAVFSSVAHVRLVFAASHLIPQAHASSAAHVCPVLSFFSSPEGCCCPCCFIPFLSPQAAAVSAADVHLTELVETAAFCSLLHSYSALLLRIRSCCCSAPQISAGVFPASTGQQL
jgi:hypothetical protein